MPAVNAFLLNLNQDGSLREQITRTNAAVIKGNSDGDAAEAIRSLKNGHAVYWTQQKLQGLNTIRAAFKK